MNWLIAGEGRKRNQISVGSCSEVSLPGKVTESDIRALNASIQAPSGLEEPCFLKRLPIGNLGKDFPLVYDTEQFCSFGFSYPFTRYCITNYPNNYEIKF